MSVETWSSVSTTYLLSHVSTDGGVIFNVYRSGLVYSQVCIASRQSSGETTVPFAEKVEQYCAVQEQV